MIGFLRDLRLLPIAVVASACLLALTAADLLLDRSFSALSDGIPGAEADATVIHSAPGMSRPSDAHGSWAQQMFNFPDSKGAPPERSNVTRLPAVYPLAADKSNAEIITGSVSEAGDNNGGKAKAEIGGATGKDEKPANAGNGGPNGMPPPEGMVVANNGAPGPSAAERAILERLQARRQELDKRGRELDIREGLIAEAEKRVEAKLAEIKQGEALLATATQKKDEAEAARFKGLVTMYENMKARDAAKIFDRLEMSVLMEVASQINPRRMSDILAQMSPETAEKLTVEMASRAKSAAKPGGELPKIEGRPTTQ